MRVSTIIIDQQQNKNVSRQKKKNKIHLKRQIQCTGIYDSWLEYTTMVYRKCVSLSHRITTENSSHYSKTTKIFDKKYSKCLNVHTEEMYI